MAVIFPKIWEAANLLFYMSLLAIVVFLDAGLPNDLAAIWACTCLNVMLSYIF
jgi:hypothetical protein